MDGQGYRDRRHAGRVLAGSLKAYAGRADGLVLALPRGGVPVAAEVAEALGLPLDVVVVRKLGVPGQEELAMGAIAGPGLVTLNAEVLRTLRLDEYAVDRAVARERVELERREQAYRGNRPRPRIRGRCVLLVDDGLATGATMRAALAALRQVEPARIVVAVPVAPPESLEAVGAEADEVVCPLVRADFFAVGQWYADFAPTSDQEVRTLLRRAWERQAGAPSTPHEA